MAGAHHPVTAFAGDGIDLPYAVVDLSNLFGRDSRESLDVTGGETLSLLVFKGRDGLSLAAERVPEDRSLAEARTADPGLAAGWNLVSLPLEPRDPALAVVLSPVLDHLEAAWAYDAAADRWLRHHRDLPPALDDLRELHAGRAYWLFLDAPASLGVSGTLSSRPISLRAGWNGAGYRFLDTVAIPEAVAPIRDKLTAIWSYDAATRRWSSYESSRPPPENDLEVLEPGRGYWFQMNGTADW